MFMLQITYVYRKTVFSLVTGNSFPHRLQGYKIISVFVCHPVCIKLYNVNKYMQL